MKICSNHKNCIHKECPFSIPHEERQDDGPAECNGEKVENILYKTE